MADRTAIPQLLDGKGVPGITGQTKDLCATPNYHNWHNTSSKQVWKYQNLPHPLTTLPPLLPGEGKIGESISHRYRESWSHWAHGWWGQQQGLLGLDYTKNGFCWMRAQLEQRERRRGMQKLPRPLNHRRKGSGGRLALLGRMSRGRWHGTLCSISHLTFWPFT